MNMRGIGSRPNEIGESKKDPKEYIGRTIESAKFENDAFTIKFTDGVSIQITDKTVSCCERRYMVCEDDPLSLAGQKLMGLNIKEVELPHGPPCEREGCEAHDVAFLEVQGDKSSITFSTHNDHNGYYSGFCLDVSEVT